MCRIKRHRPGNNHVVYYPKQNKKGSLKFVHDPQKHSIIAAGKNHGLIVDLKNNCVYGYGYGDNSFGQLGRPIDKYKKSRLTYYEGKEKAEKLIELKEIPFFTNKYIVSVAAADSYSLFLDRYGTVYAFWASFESSEKSGQIEPKRLSIKGNVKVCSISAGNDFAVFLSRKGEVLPLFLETNRYKKIIASGDTKLVSSGCNILLVDKEGQLARYESEACFLEWNFSLKAASEEALKDVRLASSGAKHYFILKNDGTVLGWAKSSTQPAVYTSINMNFGNKKIVLVSAGDEHALFLDGDGKVYGYGSSNKCQLGVKQKHTILSKIKCLENRKIIAIAAGGDHSLFLAKNGNVIMLGKSMPKPYTLLPSIAPETEWACPSETNPSLDPKPHILK